MNDPRDFISLTSFGSVGSILLALGLLGCLLHRDRSRVLAAVVVALTGGLLILDAAQLLHANRPAVGVSLAVIAGGMAVVLLLRPAEPSAALSSSRENKSAPDSANLPESENRPAKTGL